MKRKKQIMAAMCIMLLTFQLSFPAFGAEQATDTTTQVSEPIEQTKQEIPITATVPAAKASYYVSVPQEVSFGTLSTTNNQEATYEVEMTTQDLGQGCVVVTAPETGVLQMANQQQAQITFTNQFGTKVFTKTQRVTGTICIAKEAIADARKGSYTGTIDFQISYQETVEENKQEETNQVENNQSENSVTTAAIHLRKAADITEDSMCDPLFYPEADIKINQNQTAEVTMYCVSPIPGFVSSGAPVATLLLSGQSSDVKIQGTGANDYTFTTGSDSFGVKANIQSQAAKKEYEASGSFIPTAGTYDSDVFTFTIPVSAIRNSKNGAIYVNAYVSSVMNTWQSFYLLFDVPDDFGKTDGIQYGDYEVNQTGYRGATVSGLKAYAEENKEGAYTFSITKATTKKNGEGIAACAELIAASGLEGTSSYYDFLLTCTNEEETKEITELQNAVFTISLPLTISTKQTLTLYRYHGERAHALTALKKEPVNGAIDGTYYWDQTENVLHIYAAQYSVYALHVSAETVTSSTTTTSTLENTNYTAKVSMRKSTDINSVSMCNGLFYDYVDLAVNGDTTKLTMYVIDPIPNYTAEGTPLSNVQFQAGGTTYGASVDTSNKVLRAYASDSSFISTAGNYYSDPITVSMPTSELQNSANGAVLCSAYVNAVMKSTQSFYLVLSDWTKGSTSASGAATTIQKKTTTSNTIEAGSYQIPVSAKKAGSEEDSMMMKYMYPYGNLEVTANNATLTIYIQHTVAGIEGGGPNYIKYQEKECTKQEKAITIEGITYDSFQFTLEQPLPEEMEVKMYINAMSIEVSARLLLNSSQIKKAQQLSSEADVTSSKAVEIQEKQSAGNTVTSVRKNAEKTTTIEEESVAEAAKPQQQEQETIIQDALTAQSKQTGTLTVYGKSTLLLWLLGLILAGSVSVGFWTYRKVRQ